MMFAFIRVRTLFVALTVALSGIVIAFPHAAEGRTLAQVKARGILALCANPDALPHSSQSPERPGFQIEIARAIAQGLGVDLHVDWIIPSNRANLVNCDILMDAFNEPAVHEGKLKLSIPYQKSGVALGLASGASDVQGFGDLKPGKKIGVMINSLASMILGKQGLYTVPYAFETDMVEDVAKGELYACASTPATIGYYSLTHPETPLRLVYAYDQEPELSWTVSVGMRKADDALVSAVNEVLERTLADGTISKIYAKYGVEHRRP